MFPADPAFLFQTFFLLMFGHYLADFPLQGEYLSRAKDPTKNPAAIWINAMFAHCMIHAGIVFLLTGHMGLALFMLGTHICIDIAKCTGMFGKGPRAFLVDQLFHIAMIAMITVAYCSQG